MGRRNSKAVLPCNPWEKGFHHPRLHSLDASDNIHLGHSKREVSFAPEGTSGKELEVIPGGICVRDGYHSPSILCQAVLYISAL